MDTGKLALCFAPNSSYILQKIEKNYTNKIAESIQKKVYILVLVQTRYGDREERCVNGDSAAGKTHCRLCERIVLPGKAAPVAL